MTLKVGELQPSLSWELPGSVSSKYAFLTHACFNSSTSETSSPLWNVTEMYISVLVTVPLEGRQAGKGQ